MNLYHIWTVGCQMNKADSERLADGLEQAGCQQTENIEDADLIVLNSCVVRQSAENRVLSKLGSLKPLKKARPHIVIALMGCMVDSRISRLKRRFPHVDLFLRPQAFDELLELAKDKAPIGDRESVKQSVLSPCAFVPIIHGCDNFCSYCVVPYRRGQEKSRPVDEILCEVQSLVERGVKEITLLGQNVDSYGHDLAAKPDLADLLAELSCIDGLLRIRFLTSHPKDMSSKLIEAVARLEKVCEHISLPVQAGDDVILEAMRRGYTAGQYRQLVHQIRRVVPDVALSTDVIVGFPGETEEQFMKTYDLLEKFRFDTVHVAAYSPRPDTIASRTLTDDVTSEVKKERLSKIEELEKGIATQINSQLSGQTVEVLVEGRKGGKWQGRTRTNKLVFFSDKADCLGELVKVRIERTSPWALQGITLHN